MRRGNTFDLAIEFVIYILSVVISVVGSVSDPVRRDTLLGLLTRGTLIFLFINILVRDPSLDLDAEPGKKGAPKKFPAEAAVSLLPKEGLTSEEWQDLVMEELECSDKTFTKMKLEALDRGLVKPDGSLSKRSTLFIPSDDALSESNRMNGIVAKIAMAKKNLGKS